MQLDDYKSIQARILYQFKHYIEELPWVNLVDYQRIRLTSADFRDHELPAVQIYDVGESSQHVQQRTQNAWSISCEIVMKSMPGDFVDQGILLDRRLELKRKIGENVQLGLSNIEPSVGRMIHVRYVSSFTDLHLLEPLFMCRVDFEVLYEEPYVRPC